MTVNARIQLLLLLFITLFVCFSECLKRSFCLALLKSAEVLIWHIYVLKSIESLPNSFIIEHLLFIQTAAEQAESSGMVKFIKTWDLIDFVVLIFFLCKSWNRKFNFSRTFLLGKFVAKFMNPFKSLNENIRLYCMCCTVLMMPPY